MSKSKITLFIVFLLVTFYYVNRKAKISLPQAQKTAIQQLHKNLHLQSGWTKVHAAEFLIDLQMADSVAAIFKRENQLYSTQAPYRIGIWRVLAQIDKASSIWIDNIKKIARDSSAQDQSRAIEALARLKIAPDWLSDSLQTQLLASDDLQLKSNTRWAIACPSSPNTPPYLDELSGLLNSSQAIEKQTAALAIFKLKTYLAQDWEALAQLALAEPLDSQAKIYLLGAALSTANTPSHPSYQKLKEQLYPFNQSPKGAERFQFCKILATIGEREDLEILKTLLFQKNPISNINAEWNTEISAAAAYAILKITQK